MNKKACENRPLMGYIFDNYLYSKTNFNTNHLKSTSHHAINMDNNERHSRNVRSNMKPYETNAFIWHKTMNSSTFKYHTGRFYLPLFSQQEK